MPEVIRTTHSIALALIAALGTFGCASLPNGEEIVADSLRERTSLAAAAPETSPAPSEDELVALALRNNSTFRAALADLGIAEADWMRAGALPPLTFSVLFPLGSKQLEYAAKLPLDVLWLRSKRVASAKHDWEATAQTVVQHGLDLVRDVRVACADAAAAVAVQRGGAEADSDAYDAYADYAERRFRAGALPAALVTQAVLRAAARSDQRANDGAALAIAAARLAELTQTDPRASECFSRESTSPPDDALPALDGLVADALAARPDLRAAELAVEAAGERAGLARREIFQLIAVFDANGSGSDAEFGPGAELAIPLDGGRPARARADAALAKAGASYQAAVQRVTREVREAHARAEAAALTAHAWREERLPALETWAERAVAAQRAGAADVGAVYEAEIARYEGQRGAALALAAWRRARAELERAVGHRLAFAPASEPAPPVTTSPGAQQP